MRTLLAGSPALAVIAWAVIGTSGCSSPLSDIDARVEQLLQDTSGRLGPVEETPPPHWRPIRSTSSDAAMIDETPPTINPAVGTLDFPQATDVDVIARLDAYDVTPDDAIELDLESALRYAVQHAREHRFAEETYVIAGLQLLIERHLWGPRFFNDVTATVSSFGDDGLYDSSLSVLNEFSVTQRLPYGGEVSARVLADATEDLHLRVAGENVQSAEILLEADIPLLRGAGTVAREDRIQTERNLVYAARDFERFRREFLFDIATNYLDLVVQQKSIGNSRRQLASFEELERRQSALADAGRIPPFDASLAEQDTVFARDDLIGQLENYRLAVDRFKVRIGMPAEQAVMITDTMLDVPDLDIDMGTAVAAALSNRLDLQTLRDQVVDFDRGVDNARNGLLPDLDLAGFVSIPTDDDRDRAGLRFDGRDTDFQASATFGFPLDRRIEALQVRQAQIAHARSLRVYDQARDDVIVDVRRSIRDIDRARFSLQLQELNIEIARRRIASLEAAPDRAEARDESEAVNAMLRAENGRDRADRDLKVAILRYLLNSGQLRVGRNGLLISL